MKESRQNAMQKELEKKSTDELKQLHERLQERASTKAEMDQVTMVQAELNRRQAA